MKLLTKFKQNSKLLHNYLIQGECIKIMKQLKDKSISLIICDLPYGITSCKWDIIIPMDLLWKQYKRIMKDDGVIVLTAVQPFTSMLVMSNLKMFKEEIIWEKNRATGFLNAKKAHLRIHENILVFYKKQGSYNPQMSEGNKPYKIKQNLSITNSDIYRSYARVGNSNNGSRYPISVITFKKEQNCIHPTQKPINLFEYLIKTYSKPGELILDNCSGSGTTAIAAIKTGRRFFCIEKNKKYYKTSLKRIKQEIVKQSYRLF